MGSPSVATMVTSPCMGRRRWWRSAGSVQVSVGSLIQWRRTAWSLGVISSHRRVPLWTAHSCGRFRYPLRSGVLHFSRGCSILVMGCATGSWWGRSRVVGRGGARGISSSGRCGAFASCSRALMVAKMSWRAGESGGLWCRIAPGEVVTRRFPGLLLDGDGGGAVVLRRPSLKCCGPGGGG